MMRRGYEGIAAVTATMLAVWTAALVPALAQTSSIFGTSSGDPTATMSDSTFSTNYSTLTPTLPSFQTTPARAAPVS